MVPWYRCTFVLGQVLDLPAEKDEDDIDETAATTGKSMVIKTTTRQSVFLPIPGLVDPAELRPADLIGSNKDTYLVLEKLPTE